MTAKVISFPVDAGRSPSGRAASLRPQPASPFSQSGIANAAERERRILDALFGDAR